MNVKFLVLVFTLCPVAFAQQKSAQGQLTVTATVVSSVGFVLDENGTPRKIVANAAVSDDVSRLQPVRSGEIKRKKSRPKGKSPRE